MSELTPAVRERVEKLEALQEHVDTLQKEFDEKLQALRDEYEKKKAPHFKERFQIVSDPSAGIPSFWLQVLQNNMITSEEVQKADEGALEYLNDIKCSTSLGGGCAQTREPNRAGRAAPAAAHTGCVDARPTGAPPQPLHTHTHAHVLAAR